MREPCMCGALDCTLCYPEGYYPCEMCEDCPYEETCAEEGPSEDCAKVQAARDEAAQDEYDRRRDDPYYKAIDEGMGWWG